MEIAASPFDSKYYGIQIGRIVPTSLPVDLAATLEDGRRAGFVVLFLRIPDGPSPLQSALAARGDAPLETLVSRRW